MEFLYFPLFLVAAGLAVIWLFKKSRSPRGRRERSARLTTPNRSIGPRHKNANQLGSAARLQSGQGDSTQGDIWRRKRERATSDSFSGSNLKPGVFEAGFAGPDLSTGGANEVRDQDVDEADHLGLDEYLTKRAREKAEKAAEDAAAEEFSMTAMKFEPADADASDESEEEEKKKQAGFKP